MVMVVVMVVPRVAAAAATSQAYRDAAFLLVLFGRTCRDCRVRLGQSTEHGRLERREGARAAHGVGDWRAPAARPDVPDVSRVLLHSPVSRELCHAANGQDAAARPLGGVAVNAVDLVLQQPEQLGYHRSTETTPH